VQVQQATDGHAFQMQVVQNGANMTMPDSQMPEIQGRLDEYLHLFQKPFVMPPSRVADHKIPLISGAQPMKVRPYRYTPQQKIEIEPQVREMLRAGIMRLSSSPFASHVLLLRKKHGT
jgi:hypothetical protein